MQAKLLFIFVLLSGNRAMEYRYHSYTEMTLILQDLAARYPTKASLVEIGKSVEGSSSFLICPISSIVLHRTITLGDGFECIFSG